MNLPDTVVLNKKGLKILTPFGYEDFYGVNKITKDKYIHLKFSNNKELKCSLDHPIQTIEGIIKAKDLNKTTEVLTRTEGCFLVSRKIINKKVDLYDIVNSGQHHLYYTNDIISHNCEFLGSVDTLISGSKLASLVQERPIKSSSGLDVYQDPIENHNYVITIDVARGVDLDYSAFVVFDVTELPYRVVAKYKNNEIKPMLFPYIIRDTANAYNNSYILCEINDVGDQVANALHYEMECVNVLMCFQRGRAGQTVGQGFSGRKAQMGVKMSKNTKKVGCINLKAILEEEKLIVHDYDIIQELTTFVQKSNSFEAEEGAHDDLTMCLVIFAWLATQEYFKEMTDNDVRKRLYEDQQRQIEQDMAPFGFIVNGTESEDELIETDGTVWHTDEYGDVSHLWLSYSF